MALKIVEEVTEWDVPYRQPNHVYLMSGDRVIAISRWGEQAPEYLQSQRRIDRRGRKFVEVKENRWDFDLKISVSKDENPPGDTWQVQGSKDNIYTVSLLDGRWSCTCPGATFRSTCKHIEKQKLL